MINLEREYLEAEKAYDLVAFDADPNMVYELAVCYSDLDVKDITEEILCERQTMREIKREITQLSDRLTPDMEGIIVIAYEVDDTRPTPAYLVVRKELRN